MEDLSMLQKRVLVFVKAYINNCGYPPTVREIAKGADIKSTSTVHSALNALEEKGYINRDSGQSRSTVLSGVVSESTVTSIPFLRPNRSDVTFGYIDIPKTLLEDRTGVFALKSESDLLEKGILKGDVLIVRACETANEGDTCVCEDRTVSAYSEGMDIIGKVAVCIRHF